MNWKICTSDDLEELARLNMLLHEGQGMVPMGLIDVMEQLGRWMALNYTAVLFRQHEKTVGYVLFRQSDESSDEFDSRVYIRQMLVVRDQQKKDVGRQVFETLCDQIWPENCEIFLDAGHDSRRAQHFLRSIGLAEDHPAVTRQLSEHGS